MSGAQIGAPLEDLAARYGLSEEQVGRLRKLGERLSSDARAPTTVRDPRDVAAHHLADSLVALELAQVRQAPDIADLGSGAGLPGMVLAVALPAATVTLVESQARKCAYMASLVAALGMGNVRVACARAEEWSAGMTASDLVVARALASQPVVMEYAAPLLKAGGWLVEWRGARDREEESASESAAEILGLRKVEVLAVKPFPESRDRHLHVFEKVAATPARFPRRAGQAQRRPLGREA